MKTRLRELLRGSRLRALAHPLLRPPSPSVAAFLYKTASLGRFRHHRGRRTGAPLCIRRTEPLRSKRCSDTRSASGLPQSLCDEARPRRTTRLSTADGRRPLPCLAEDRLANLRCRQLSSKNCPASGNARRRPACQSGARSWSPPCASRRSESLCCHQARFLT